MSTTRVQSNIISYWCWTQTLPFNVALRIKSNSWPGIKPNLPFFVLWCLVSIPVVSVQRWLHTLPLMLVCVVWGVFGRWFTLSLVYPGLLCFPCVRTRVTFAPNAPSPSWVVIVHQSMGMLHVFKEVLRTSLKCFLLFPKIWNLIINACLPWDVQETADAEICSKCKVSWWWNSVGQASFTEENGQSICRVKMFHLAD